MIINEFAEHTGTIAGWRLQEYMAPIGACVPYGLYSQILVEWMIIINVS